MRSYFYHSMDRRFPGSIEQQKRQFPDAVWHEKPMEVRQDDGKFQGGGGRLIGALPNGDQIQEHLGVLVAISTSAETWDAKRFEVDLARIRRARQQREEADQ